MFLIISVLLDLTNYRVVLTSQLLDFKVRVVKVTSETPYAEYFFFYITNFISKTFDSITRLTWNCGMTFEGRPLILAT